jgi:hypothetical protein
VEAEESSTPRQRSCPVSITEGGSGAVISNITKTMNGTGEIEDIDGVIVDDGAGGSRPRLTVNNLTGTFMGIEMRLTPNSGP